MELPIKESGPLLNRNLHAGCSIIPGGEEWGFPTGDFQHCFLNKVPHRTIKIFLGLVIDVFSGTPGLNSASATLLAMFQPGLVKLFVSMDRHDVLVPGSDSMGGRPFAGYLLLMAAIHHTVYFILRSIPLGDWTVLVLKVVFSVVMTFILMTVAEHSFSNTGSKRS